MNHTYTCAGFTLAELLTVVIIIAILSSLSLGYYKRSVEQSRFAEGMAAASALVEAVNQSYFDQQMEGETPTTQPKVKTLDVMLAAQKACASSSDYCIATPRFEVQVQTGGNVRAYRGTASSYKYYINIQPSFAASNRDKITCGATSAVDTAAGKAFCESMGYTSCSELECSQPASSAWSNPSTTCEEGDENCSE